MSGHAGWLRGCGWVNQGRKRVIYYPSGWRVDGVRAKVTEEWIRGVRVKAGYLWIYRLATVWMPETRFFGVKAWLLRKCGAEIGRDVRICSSACFLGTGRLVIGDDVWIGPQGLFATSGAAAITIGSHVDIAPRVTIETGSHTIDPDGEHIGGAGYSASVTVGSGSWIGACAVILPGVSLAEKTLVAAGAVVTRDVSERGGACLVAGVPATCKKIYTPQGEGR